MVNRTLQFRFHFLLLAALAVTTVAARVFWAQRNELELRGLREAASRDAAARKSAYWSSLEYAPSDSANFEGEFISKINWKGLDLQPVQAASLQARLREVLAYLQSPTVEEYLRLKTEGLHHEFKPSRSTAAALQAHSWRGVSPSPEQLVRAVWEVAQPGTVAGSRGSLTTFQDTYQVLSGWSLDTLGPTSSSGRRRRPPPW